MLLRGRWTVYHHKVKYLLSTDGKRCIELKNKHKIKYQQIRNTETIPQARKGQW